MHEAPLTPPFGLDMLHAYADYQTTPAESTTVEAWLRQHPEAAAQVAAWRQQNQALLQHFAEVEHAWPARPHALSSHSAFAPRTGLQAAAIAAVWVVPALLIGSAVGWWSHAQWGAATLAQRAAPWQQTAHIALAAHTVYSVEKRHPVEVGAQEQAHLVAWLSKRLGQPLQVPNLQSEGYQLLGGRLLAADDGPAAHFLYENPQGQRLTLVVKPTGERVGAGEAGFKLAEEAGLNAFYWYESKLGYALSGALPRDHLLRLARNVYQQLSPSNTSTSVAQ